MKTFRRIFALLCAASMLIAAGCSGAEVGDSRSTENDSDIISNITEEEIMDSLNNGIVIDSTSENGYKAEYNANPLSPSIMCADPTAVEYNGRLYVYGTNDQQQAEEGTKNDYAHIKSLVVFSTDDMVNWIYHGRINVGEIAPWIYNSWAPSIAARLASRWYIRICPVLKTVLLLLTRECA